MTTLQQTQPPILTWELWEYEDRILARIITEWSFYKAKGLYEIAYEFRGRSVHYCICSHDASITRAMALEWAVAHNAGRFQTYRIDLSPCQPTPIK